MTTADRIRQRRLELGLTQLELAKRLGFSTKAAVSKIECQGDNVTLKNVEKFAYALHCAPAYLMGWSDEKYDNEPTYHETANERTDTFIVLYNQLDEEQKKLIDNLLTSLVSKK